MDETHIHHINSMAAWYELAVNEREREIMPILERATRPITDRQVCRALRQSDMNYVRPSITRLLQRGALVDRGSVVDPQTSRRVRVCSIAPHLVESTQAELFA